MHVINWLFKSWNTGHNQWIAQTGDNCIYLEKLFRTEVDRSPRFLFFNGYIGNFPFFTHSECWWLGLLRYSLPNEPKRITRHNQWSNQTCQGPVLGSPSRNIVEQHVDAMARTVSGHPQTPCWSPSWLFIYQGISYTCIHEKLYFLMYWPEEGARPSTYSELIIYLNVSTKVSVSIFRFFMHIYVIFTVPMDVLAPWLPSHPQPLCWCYNIHTYPDEHCSCCFKYTNVIFIMSVDVLPPELSGLP